MPCSRWHTRAPFTHHHSSKLSRPLQQLSVSLSLHDPYRWNISPPTRFICHAPDGIPELHSHTILSQSYLDHSNTCQYHYLCIVLTIGTSRCQQGFFVVLPVAHPISSHTIFFVKAIYITPTHVSIIIFVRSIQLEYLAENGVSLSCSWWLTRTLLAHHPLPKLSKPLQHLSLSLFLHNPYSWDI